MSSSFFRLLRELGQRQRVQRRGEKEGGREERREGGREGRREKGRDVGVTVMDHSASRFLIF